EAEAEELTAAQEGHDDALGAALDAAQAAAKRVEAEEEALDRLTGDAARLAARHQAARRRMDEAEGEVRRTAADLEKAEGEARTLAAAIGEGETALAAAAAAMETARGHAAQAEKALGAAEAERAEAQQGESETRAAAAAAAGEASALRAEAEALRKLLARDAGEAGQLLDRVSVSPGYEAALGAALGDDLRAPEAEAGSGWRPLSDYDADAPAWGEGAAPLAAQVQAPAALSRRLARIAVVADVAAGDRLQPGLAPGERLVTREGDLWRWDGWRVAAGDASSTAALRLQQRNRLAALETALAEAEAKSDAARAAHAQAKARLAQAQQADARSREARRRADADRAEAEKRHGRAEGDLELRRARHAAVAESLHARADAAQAARDAAAEAAREAEALEDLDAARAAAEAAKTTVGEARGALLHARSEADGLRRVGESRAKRLAEIARERAGWLRRKETAGTRIDELRTRIDETEEARKAAAETPGELELRRQALVAQIAQSEKRCQTAADALAAAEAAERQGRQAARDAETAAAEAREARARAQALGESAAERVVEAARRIAEEAEATPETLLERLDVDPETAPDASRTELDIVDLRRKRDALGAVNLRAEEDAAEVQEEKDQLAAEKIDLEAAIAKLRHGVASLNSEGRKRLLAAFDEVNANFAALFTRLFGGGQASLQLVESEDPLDAGLEILCMPPGKKLSTLSLLSGGEQTLTALALIFGVFLANPAPICVLDEVDAPLDDANVTRFCDLLDEMRRRADTRFLIITHHAVTMARMDRLFGVTMAEQGVSQLVSVDLERAEALVEG
ncbi:MAG: chromosome segregation protein SMC, partial [Pseudomonadota bacterium]